MLGAAQLLLLSIVTGQRGAAVALRPAVALLLVLNAVSLGLVIWDVRATLARAYDRATVGRLAFLVVGGAMFAPLWLLAVGGPERLAVAVTLILLGALVVRIDIVRLPHLLTQGRGP
jgi:hypothetical protein